MYKLGCRHSSVDSSAPSIRLPRVRVPSTPSMLFSIYICHLNWNVKRTKINKKRPGLAHFKKKQMYNINFADDWSRTADLWYGKRPLYHLSHNHFPISWMFAPWSHGFRPCWLSMSGTIVVL